MARVGANHPNDAFASHYFTLFAAFFNTGFNFHIAFLCSLTPLFSPEGNPTPIFVVRGDFHFNPVAGHDSDSKFAHFAA
jgi:hypothetical protein